MMIPFSLQCIKCGEYMYRGKKFNSRKEDVIGDDYLGIKKYRFYIKCCVCNNEIAFKTDPKNQDYVCESGLRSVSLFCFPCLGGFIRSVAPWTLRRLVARPPARRRRRRGAPPRRAAVCPRCGRAYAEHASRAWRWPRALRELGGRRAERAVPATLLPRGTPSTRSESVASRSSRAALLPPPARHRRDPLRRRHAQLRVLAPAGRGRGEVRGRAQGGRRGERDVRARVEDA